MSGLDTRIAARREQLDRLAGYFTWAADRGYAVAAGLGSRGASQARGRAAMNRMTARQLRDMPVGPGDQAVSAWLERWERLCEGRMDAEGFRPYPAGADGPLRLWFADGAAQAARDAMAVIRTGSVLISDWDRPDCRRRA